MMLVDLERHDLGHASVASTVAWDRWRVEAFPNIQHMVSKVGKVCFFWKDLGGKVFEPDKRPENPKEHNNLCCVFRENTWLTSWLQILGVICDFKLGLCWACP